MVKKLIQHSTKIALLATVGCLLNCKKTDNQVAVSNSRPNSIASTHLVASINGNFTAITWGTAKAQPTATHELQGEVVHGSYIFSVVLMLTNGHNGHPPNARMFTTQ